MGHEHAAETGARSDCQNGGECERTLVGGSQVRGATQQRIGERNHGCADTHRQQAGNQRPEFEADVPDRPEDGEHEDQSEKLGAGALAPDDQDPRQDEPEAGKQEVEAATERDELAAADREKQACEHEDRAEDEKPYSGQTRCFVYWMCYGVIPDIGVVTVRCISDTASMLLQGSRLPRLSSWRRKPNDLQTRRQFQILV